MRERDRLFKFYCQETKPVVVILKPKARTSPNSLFVKRNIITNKTSIAETFNNSFVNVGSSLGSKIPKAKTFLVSTYKKIFKFIFYYFLLKILKLRNE